MAVRDEIAATLREYGEFTRRERRKRRQLQREVERRTRAREAFDALALGTAIALSVVVLLGAHQISHDFFWGGREFERAECALGVGSACFDMALDFQEGRHVARDLERARAGYQSACDLGYAGGCQNLGAILLNQYDHFALTASTAGQLALEYMNRACNMDERNCFGLGTMYLRGDGVLRDELRAEWYYWRSCQAGEGDGCSQLATFFELGGAMQPDPEIAAKLREHGCSLGSTRSCQRRATEITKNKEPGREERSLRLLEIACRGENADACVRLGDLLAKSPDEASRGRAAVFFERGCALGEPAGCTRLWIIYRESDAALSEGYRRRACELNAELCPQAPDAGP